jgi:hypothetical protein
VTHPDEVRTLVEVGAAFGCDGGEKVRKDSNAGFGEAASGFETDFAGELIERASQRGNGIGEAMESRVAADFADGAQDADGAELLEDVGIAEDGGFEGRGLVAGLVLADAVEDGGDFGFGKAGFAEDLRGALAGESHVVPAAEGLGIFGAVADEDAEVVKPGRCADDIAIVVEAGADGFRERVQARLMAEFVDGASLFRNDPLQDLEVMGFHTKFVPESTAAAAGCARL